MANARENRTCGSNLTKPRSCLSTSSGIYQSIYSNVEWQCRATNVDVSKGYDTATTLTRPSKHPSKRQRAHGKLYLRTTAPEVTVKRRRQIEPPVNNQLSYTDTDTDNVVVTATLFSANANCWLITTCLTVTPGLGTSLTPPRVHLSFELHNELTINTRHTAVTADGHTANVVLVALPTSVYISRSDTVGTSGVESACLSNCSIVGRDLVQLGQGGEVVENQVGRRKRGQIF